MTDALPQPTAPPTEPGQWDPNLRQRPVWPTVWGVIAIVFAAMGILGYLASFIMLVFFVPAMASITAPGDPAAMASVAATASIQAINSIVHVALAAMLLAAGIGLLLRKPWSVRVALVWAVLRMVVAVVAAGTNYYVQREQILASQGASSPNAIPPAFETTMLALTVAMTIGWGWALPIAMLIWFRLAKVKAEVARWSPAGVASAPGVAA